MHILDPIFSAVWDISDWFYEAYQIVADWVWPFYLLGQPLYWLHRATWSLLTPIAQVQEWISFMTGEIGRMITWSDLTEWQLNLFSALMPLFDFVDNAYAIVSSYIWDWWAIVAGEVWDWVEDAKGFAQSLVANTEAWLGNLQSSWDNFTTTILPNLPDWWGVQSLINSALSNYLPFYDELVSLWSDIREFFTDPEQYVYNKLDIFFERFW